MSDTTEPKVNRHVYFTDHSGTLCHGVITGVLKTKVVVCLYDTEAPGQEMRALRPPRAGVVVNKSEIQRVSL